MSAHTPGPWRVVRLQCSDVVFGAFTREPDDIEVGTRLVGERICRLYRRAVNPKHRDDASLIAAAPDLLTAANKARAVIGRLAMSIVMGHEIGKDIEAAVNEAQDALNAAIAKAEGRQP